MVQPNFRKNRPIILASLAAIAIGGYAIYYLGVLERNEPLDQAANKIFLALERNDTATLRHYVHRQEKEALGLTDAKISAFVRWHQACLNGFISDGKQKTDKGQEGYLLMATRHFRKGDLNVPVTLALSRTEEGPRFFLTGSLIPTDLFAKYAHRYRNESTHVQLYSSIRDGIAGERSKLNGMALPGFVDTQAKLKVVTWDQYFAFANRCVARYSQR